VIDPKFAAKVAKLDPEGLAKLRGELVVKNERARMRFSKSRSIKDGEAHRKRREELAHVRTRIALLPRPEISEDGAS
jgi:DNA-directed RNA polymerase subunit F